ncbi:TIR domain-containing protein [Chitinophaga rupis]|uniref:TIR domain-containing protein n=1 Tax=Chitinophaga rupis TaxID=573321 RepID=A0A1H8AVQ8_9BACT|nr:toll/interleukin-1 receptor domain-containing protein [Chitinophaga rupis]SEM74556.1 TIR domain-containing protein [Chitinophaga rupis]
MEKVGVFLSYSHANKELRDEIINILSSDDNIEIYYDEKNILIGYPIHIRISTMLNASHIVIAIATKEWLGSTETREEFTRAHERKKHLVCFADESTNLGALPQFIRDARQIRFSPNHKQQALQKLVPAIRGLSLTKDFAKQIMYKRLREIEDEVEQRNPEFYRLNLANDHIEHVLEETKNILGDGPYSIDIGNENGYLLKAISIFESASNIYAVSLTGISTFWDDRKYEDKAIQYLKKQSNKKIKIIRLFVFSNCTQVNDYKNILQAHHVAYGADNKGAVLMCSKKTYEKFLSDITRSQLFFNLFDDDFGILSYIDVDKKEHFIEARLDNNVFKFRPVSINHPTEGGTSRFITKLKEIEEKLLYGDFQEDYRIIRWDPVFVRQPDIFSDKIKLMFEEDNEVEKIIHLAIFKCCASRQVEEGLFELVNKLKNLNGRFFNFRKIELLTRTHIQAFDGRLGIELLFNEDVDYIMMMEFSNEKNLREYYSHTEHASEREKIYGIVNPGIAEHYHALRALNRSEPDYRAKAIEISTLIERSMAPYFFRLDIRNFEIPEQIVRQKGIPFATFTF